MPALSSLIPNTARFFWTDHLPVFTPKKAKQRMTNMMIQSSSYTWVILVQICGFEPSLLGGISAVRTKDNFLVHLPYFLLLDWFCSVQIENQDIPSKIPLGCYHKLCLWQYTRFSTWLLWNIRSNLHQTRMGWYRFHCLFHTMSLKETPGKCSKEA